jgi:uncharacterized cupin superfamily protein
VFIDPGLTTRSVQHLGEEFIYVLKERSKYWWENRTLLKPSECIHFNSSIVHKLRNLSVDKAELLVVLYTP